MTAARHTAAPAGAAGAASCTGRGRTCAGRRRRAAPRRAGLRAAAVAAGARGVEGLTAVRGEVVVVMKFGGSSVADEACMRRVAEIVLKTVRAGGRRPCVVLSAMGDTTNALLTMGELACGGGEGDGDAIDAIMRRVEERHTAAMAALQIDAATADEVRALLGKVSQLLGGLRVVGEFSPRASDLLSSFGERMSTRIFAALLRREGYRAEQIDSFSEGMFVSTDDFTNGDILDETYENLRRRLGGSGDAIPIVTGFLARGAQTGAITTLGRGGSDLSATVLGRALRLREVQVWKDVDGVMTTDPRIVSEARTVSELTFEEATELAYFGATVLHPQSMIPAMSSPAGPDALRVRVMNSHRQSFEGTVIGHAAAAGAGAAKRGGDLTSIVLKRKVTMLEIVSTRMLGQYGFLRRVFGVFEANKISVDLVTTSEVSVCVTLDPSKIWTRQLQQQELDRLVSDFEEFASVQMNGNLAILSLIGDWSRQPGAHSRAPCLRVPPPRSGDPARLTGPPPPRAGERQRSCSRGPSSRSGRRTSA